MALNKITSYPDRFQAPDGTPFEVTPEGSLSLLALGYRGLMAWRAERIEAAKSVERSRAPRKA
ncbi:MAG: hypothetical protein IPN44_11995 [Flavobacteriales bacterium]|nr:hypothetical protein [Flavobacteriales bacterium]